MSGNKRELLSGCGEHHHLVTHVLDQEEGDAIVRQRLPRTDVLQLGIHQWQVLYIGVGLQDTLHCLHKDENSVNLCFLSQK